MPSFLEAARQRLAKNRASQEELDVKARGLFEGEVKDFFDKKKTTLLTESLPAVFTSLVNETRNIIQTRENVQLEENWRYYFYIHKDYENVNNPDYGYPRKYHHHDYIDYDGKVNNPDYGYPRKHYQYNYDPSREILFKVWQSPRLRKKIKMGISVDLIHDNSNSHMHVGFDWDETSGHITFDVGSDQDWSKRRQREWDGEPETFNKFAEDLTQALDEGNYAFKTYGIFRSVGKNIFGSPISI